MPGREEPAISEVTRRNICDTLSTYRVCWAGRLDEDAFLSRLYDLGAMRSTDNRFRSADRDIWQHRVRNRDWEDDWVFTDSRFDLIRAPDEDFLKFLCETVHPVVRTNTDEANWLLAMYNQFLAADGWELSSCGELSGRPVFAARRVVEGATFAVDQAKRVAEGIDGSYVSRQITRMENAVLNDPELAIGTAKEFVETICRTILLHVADAPVPAPENLPQLVKATLRHLRLTPDDIPDSAKAADTIRVLLSNLATIAKGLAELRNVHGTGHGKQATAIVLEVRHARLAVGAATALGVFLFETFQEQRGGALGATGSASAPRDPGSTDDPLGQTMNR